MSQIKGKKSKPELAASSPPPPHRLLSLLIGQDTGRVRALLAMLVAAAVIGGGGYAVWRKVGEQVLAGKQYTVLPEDIQITDPPPWIRSDIKRDVLRDSGLDRPQPLLEDKLVQRVAQAFELNPWVERVEKVTKSTPALIDVDLVYRRPVLMVDVPGGVFPVDVHGVVLPSADFSKVEASRYPRLSGVGVVTELFVGTEWQDARVVGAAEIAAALQDVWTQWNLDRIIPARHVTEPIQEPTYELKTKQETIIYWGRCPTTPAEVEPSVADKIARLSAIFAERGTLEGTDGPQEIDLRHLGRSPSTAQKPSEPH